MQAARYEIRVDGRRVGVASKRKQVKDATAKYRNLGYVRVQGRRIK